jgi:tetratricopeptide (TPR) repeat protein
VEEVKVLVMEVDCQNCGTSVSSDAVMCYACGANLNPNPHNLNEEQLSISGKAEAAMDSEDWTQAIGHYDKLLSERPDIGHFWVCKALAYGYLGRTEETWKYLCKAIEADPGNDEPWQVRLEFSIDGEGDYLKRHIDEFRYRFGKNPESLYGLAENIFMLSSDHCLEVQRLCDEALLIDPNHRKTRKLLKKVQKVMKKRN